MALSLKGKAFLTLRCCGVKLYITRSACIGICQSHLLQQPACEFFPARSLHRQTFTSLSLCTVCSHGTAKSVYVGHLVATSSVGRISDSSCCLSRRFASESAKSDALEQPAAATAVDQKTASSSSTDDSYVHQSSRSKSISDIPTGSTAVQVDVYPHTLRVEPLGDHVSSSVLSSTDSASEHVAGKQPSHLADFEELLAPKSMEPSFNLTPFVTKSEVLQKLVGLGVDLSAVEKVPEAADYLVQSSWEADVQPKLLFLRDVGVQNDDLGKVLTKNPLLLKEDLADLQVRVDYLQSKKFTTDDIGRIVTSAPVMLLMPVTMVDKKLGYLQKTFGLTGDEVRAVAVRLPKIVPWKLQKLKDTRFYIKDMLGFSDGELKAMLLTCPKVYLTDKYQLGKRFDFLHNTMGLPHKQLALWPMVFRTRLHILQQRHRFLLSVDRAQYDATKENYVSLKALVTGRDRDFCFHVAKVTTTQFNNFLKAI